MEILWTTMVIELGASSFDAARDFWCEATESTLSAPTLSTQTETLGDGSRLLPANGDPYIQVRRIDDEPSGIGLSLHVESLESARREAIAKGATAVADSSVVKLRSPGGLLLRLVPHHGEAQVPLPVGKPVPNRLDQLSVDIPPQHYELECNFWAGITGWHIHESGLAEFRSLERPDHIPLRFLLQRLDTAEVDQQTRAHIDIACGDHIDEVARSHVALGATSLGRTKRWLPMRDPGGLTYCLTPRSP